VLLYIYFNVTINLVVFFTFVTSLFCYIILFEKVAILFEVAIHFRKSSDSLSKKYQFTFEKL